MYEELQYAIIIFTQGFSSPLLDAFLLGVNILGNPAFWFIAAALFYWIGKERTTLHIMNVLLFTAVVVGAIKVVAGAERPSSGIVQRKVDDTFNELTFPSGHSTTAAAIYGHNSGILKRNIRAIALAFVLLVAFARIYLGAHFPIDVIAGLAIGFIIGKINLRLERRFEKAHFRLSKLQDEILVVVAVAVFLAGLYIINSLALLALFAGFYAGFFAWQELGIKQRKLERRNLAVKLIAGYAGLALLMLVPELVLPTGGSMRFPLYFVAGAWVSLIYPWLAGKLSF